MSKPEELLRRMREKRMRWVELEPAGDGFNGTPGDPVKQVRIIRPTEVEIARHIARPGGGIGIDLETVVRFTVEWSGFRECDLLGAGIGSSDDVPYRPELWSDLVADRSAWLRLVSQAILDDVVTHIELQERARKN